AVAERQPGKIAIQLVGPLVIGADKAARIALRFLAEAHAAMGAAVFDHVDAAITVAHHDDRTLADPGLAVIARLRDLDLQRDIAPMAMAVEETVELAAIDRRIGIGPEGDAAGARALPAADGI